MLYQYAYANKARCGTLIRSLRFQKAKENALRQRVGQTELNPLKAPLSDWPSKAEARKQLGYTECDTVTGANHNGAIVTMVERKDSLRIIFQVAHKNPCRSAKQFFYGPSPLLAGSKRYLR